MHIPPPPVQKAGFPWWGWLLVAIVPILLCGGAVVAVSSQMSSLMEGFDEESSWGDDGDPGSDYSAMYLIEGVDEFVEDIGRWPTQEEGLDVLMEKPADLPKWDGPYAEKFYLVDWWDKPMVYEALPTGYRVTSLGSDGKPGGRGEAADIVIERKMEPILPQGDSLNLKSK